MNRKNLLGVYEHLESLVGRLPAPLKLAILDELRPIKQIFLSQRPARFALLGQLSANAPSFFSALTEHELREMEGDGRTGWITYDLRSRGAFRMVDYRHPLWIQNLTAAQIGLQLGEEQPDLFLFLCRSEPTTAEIEQAAKVVACLQERFAKIPLIAVLDVDPSVNRDQVDRLRQQIWTALKSNAILAEQFVRVSAVSSFVRFRHDGTIDLEQDDRRGVSDIASLIARELPEEAQVEAARLFKIRVLQKEIAGRLTRSVTTVCGAIGCQPIPLADFPVLTALQVAMVAGIMQIGGRDLSMRAAVEFMGALGLNVGVGMALREGARAAVKILPGWGNAVSGGFAAAGTFAIGHAASAYFVDGLPLNEVKRLFRRKNRDRPIAQNPRIVPSRPDSPKGGVNKLLTNTRFWRRR